MIERAQPRLLPPREAARLVGFHPRTLAIKAETNAILKKGVVRLPGKKGHRHRRYREDVILAYIASLGRKATA